MIVLLLNMFIFSDHCRSRGFGFITYKEADSIDQAQGNRPHKLDDREIDTKRAMPRDDPSNQASVKKMFVGGVKEDTTEEHIRETFAGFGNITEVNMITDKNTGKNKGFCFVSFDDHDSVDKAVCKFTFLIPMIPCLFCSFSYLYDDHDGQFCITFVCKCLTIFS